jgi:glutaredoxin 3
MHANRAAIAAGVDRLQANVPVLRPRTLQPFNRRMRVPEAETSQSDDKTATLYRMILPEETCPFGVRAKQMLEQHGYAIEEHILHSREEVDAFEQEQGVQTTPQVFIDGKRIGGSDALEAYLAG